MTQFAFCVPPHVCLRQTIQMNILVIPDSAGLSFCNLDAVVADTNRLLILSTALVLEIFPMENSV